MKRFSAACISALLALALLLSLASCGGSPAADPSETALPDAHTARPSGSETVSAPPEETAPADPEEPSRQDETDAPEETSSEAPEPEDTALWERCDAFSVALPGWWEGKYLVEGDAESLRFRYRTSPGDTEGIYLFIIALTEGPDDIEEAGLGGDGEWYEVCRIEKDGALRYVTVFYPGDFYGVPADAHDEYMDMFRLTDDLDTRIRGENGWQITQFDYTDSLGVYTAKDGAGGEYTLTLLHTQWNMLYGDLAFQYNGGPPEEIENVSIRMFQNAGVLAWARQSETDPDEWTFGSGVFMIEQDGDETGYSLKLSAPGDSWTTTDGYLPLEFWRNAR